MHKEIKLKSIFTSLNKMSTLWAYNTNGKFLKENSVIILRFTDEGLTWFSSKEEKKLSAKNISSNSHWIFKNGITVTLIKQ